MSQTEVSYKGFLRCCPNFDHGSQRAGEPALLVGKTAPQQHLSKSIEYLPSSLLQPNCLILIAEQKLSYTENTGDLPSVSSAQDYGPS
jgi:hypothetical protein